MNVVAEDNRGRKHSRPAPAARSVRVRPGWRRLSNCRARPGLCCLPLLLLLCASSTASAHVWTELEEAMGKLIVRDMTARYGLVEEPLLNTWVEELGNRIAAHSSRSHLRYRFLILNASESNAFSLPGGYVLVTMGLLNRVVSDEELAGVIAHEVAHADNEDFLRLLRRQALHLGVQSLLRGEVADGWLIGSQFAQVLDTLHASRRHEAQADTGGVKLAFAARYDPEGLVAFLRTVRQRHSRADRLFATHPAGEARVQTSTRAIAELYGQDYPGLLALADSLRDRLSLTRAAELYAEAARLHPSQTAPLLRLGDLQTRRGHLDEARAAFRQALERDPLETTARSALAPLSPRPPVPAEPLALPDDLRAQVRSALIALHPAAQASYEAEKRLHASLRAFERDYDIAAALQTAQVIAPETNDRAYLATVARAYYALARADKEARRQGDIMARATSVRTGWERVGAQLLAPDKVSSPPAANSQTLQQVARTFIPQARPAIQTVATALETDGRACRELTTATRMLGAAFLALVASGPQQPLGRLNYTRFLLLQAEITAADGRIRKLELAGDKLLREVLDQHVAVTALGLSTLHATAGPPLFELDREIVARRLQSPLEEGLLGPAAAAVLDPQLERHSLRALQTKDALLRLSYLDLRRERP